MNAVMTGGSAAISAGGRPGTPSGGNPRRTIPSPALRTGLPPEAFATPVITTATHVITTATPDSPRQGGRR